LALSVLLIWLFYYQKQITIYITSALLIGSKYL
jgi:hypothetical protein